MYISIYYDLQTSFKMQIWNLIGYRKPYDFRQRMKCKFFGLKRSEKRQERVPDRLIKKLTNLQKFFVFLSFYKLVSKVKILLVCRKNIVDFISVIILA